MFPYDKSMETYEEIKECKNVEFQAIEGLEHINNPQSMEAL